MLRIVLLLLAALAVTAGQAWPQGNPLGPEFRVNTYTTDSQYLPDVAADASGNFVVVWGSYLQDGSSHGIFGQRYNASGAPVGPEFLVNTYTQGSQFDPSVAADSSGNFVVVWQSYGEIFGQRYANTGTPLGPEFRVNTVTTYVQHLPSVSSDSSGNFVVVWSGFDQSSGGVFGQRYASSGAALGPEFRVNTFTMSNQSHPGIASDASGNFVVVWTSAYQGGILGQRFASTGTPLGPEFFVTTTGNFSYAPSIGTDSSGNFVVVWYSNVLDGSGWGAFGRGFASSGAPLGPVFQVNTYTTGDQYGPDVAVDAAGNFVVVWESDLQDGSNHGVFGQRYASSGVPLGSEFRVNTYTTSVQAAPSVAVDSSGNFVVVWSSGAQDGSSDGVFGQRYSQIVPVELMHFGIE